MWNFITFIIANFFRIFHLWVYLLLVRIHGLLVRRIRKEMVDRERNILDGWSNNLRHPVLRTLGLTSKQVFIFFWAHKALVSSFDPVYSKLNLISFVFNIKLFPIFFRMQRFAWSFDGRQNLLFILLLFFDLEIFNFIQSWIQLGWKTNKWLLWSEDVILD